MQYALIIIAASSISKLDYHRKENQMRCMVLHMMPSATRQCWKANQSQGVAAPCFETAHKEQTRLVQKPAQADGLETEHIFITLDRTAVAAAAHTHYSAC
jgi:cellobiose-specific phosphotransferase system component IIA